jgi:hypothetical protein
MINLSVDKNVITLSVLGEFTVADFKQFEEHILYGLKFQGPINLLIDLRDMIGYTVDVVWEELKFTRQHQWEFAKVAIVTADQWVTWSAWIQRLFVECEIEVFADYDEAQAWVAG